MKVSNLLWRMTTRRRAYNNTAADNEEAEFEIVPEKDKAKAYDVDSKSLSVQDIEKDMKADIEHIVSIFGLEVCS
jgi:hypothetical protein